MRKNRRKIQQCRNCLAQLNQSENYCANCGQENHVHNNSLMELWNDFLGSFFNFDGKIWQTIQILFLHPGKVPKDYFEGKKVRYVPPMRLFLFCSFLFFLSFQLSEIGDNEVYQLPKFRHNFLIDKNQFKLLNQVHQNDQRKIVLQQISKNKNLKQVIKKNFTNIEFIQPHKHFFTDSILYTVQIFIPEDLDSVNFDNTQDNSSRLSITQAKQLLAQPQKYDSLYLSIGESKIYYWIMRPFKKFLLKTSIDGGVNFMEDDSYMEKIKSYYSYSLIFMLPFSGLILYFLFYNRQKKYYQSFIYSSYAHVYMLIVLILYIILFNIFGFLFDFNELFDFISGIVLIAVFLYLIFYNIKGTSFFYNTSQRRSVALGLAFVAIYSVISFIISFLVLGIAIIY